MRDRDHQKRASKTRAGWLLWAPALVMTVACATLWTPSELTGYHRTEATIAGAQLVGADDCLTCHEDVRGHPSISADHADCESCHGPGSLHVESEEPADIRFPAPADCLGCHESGRSTHLAWGTGEHARAGVICSDCHDPHNREPHNVREDPQLAFTRLDPNSNLCASCHLDVASRLNLPSHHPLREGMLGCTDCHSPHEDRRVTLGLRTELCASCHQDHVGPWVYEHEPAAEDCTICHNPHGAASYDLLDTSQPGLCLSCHSLPDDRHTKAGEGLASGDPLTGPIAAAFYTRCTDCHGAIHGSYQDVHLRR